MIDWTKPVKTVDGNHPVRVLCTDSQGDRPVILLVQYNDGSDVLTRCTLDGRLYNGAKAPCVRNKKVKKWKWISSKSGEIAVSCKHFSEKEWWDIVKECNITSIGRILESEIEE